jgi:glycyl-tRNA synthetase
MFKTQMGAVEDSSAVIYLRPETAQGHFVNFLNYKTAARNKIPFGIAAVGKSFRNEITPGNFIFRTREFEQMEMQYFVKPGTDESFFKHWKETRYNFFIKYGLQAENLRFHPHPKEELAHYAKAAEDIQYNFPMGFSELEGIHNRTDFDLTAHAKMSGKNLEYVGENGERFVPFVIETAVGCDRLILAFLCEAFREETLEDDQGKTDTRVVLGLHPAIAPVKVAVLPLMKKPELMAVAKQIHQSLVEEFEVVYDDTAQIGKRYRRQDEVGTPFCLTVDYDSLVDQSVTVRDRDTMAQVRVKISDLETYLRPKLK